MSREDAIERTRKQLMRLIEGDDVAPTYRVQAAAILLKSQRSGQEPTRLKGGLRSVLRSISDAGLVGVVAIPDHPV